MRKTRLNVTVENCRFRCFLHLSSAIPREVRVSQSFPTHSDSLRFALTKIQLRDIQDSVSQALAAKIPVRESALGCITPLPKKASRVFPTNTPYARVSLLNSMTLQNPENGKTGPGINILRFRPCQMGD